MSWSIGYDENWKRDIGYGVPAYCDHPECQQEINRGLSYVCGGEPYGGEHGCGLYFCGEHLLMGEAQQCERCYDNKQPFDPKPDHPRWTHHKMTDESWQAWRDEQKPTSKPSDSTSTEASEQMYPISARLIREIDYKRLLKLARVKTTKKVKPKTWEQGFYGGVLSAIAVCDIHGQETIIEEIADSVGRERLIAAATEDYDKKILKRNGIVASQSGRGKR